MKLNNYLGFVKIAVFSQISTVILIQSHGAHSLSLSQKISEFSRFLDLSHPPAELFSTGDYVLFIGADAHPYNS